MTFASSPSVLGPKKVLPLPSMRVIFFLKFFCSLPHQAHKIKHNRVRKVQNLPDSQITHRISSNKSFVAEFFKLTMACKDCSG